MPNSYPPSRHHGQPPTAPYIYQYGPPHPQPPQYRPPLADVHHQPHAEQYPAAPFPHYAHQPPVPPSPIHHAFYTAPPLDPPEDSNQQNDDEEEEEDDHGEPQQHKPKKSWRDYPRYNFNKSQGRLRLKASAEALKRAADDLEAAKESLRVAQEIHDALLQDHRELSHKVVDELLEAEKPRPWNKAYFALVEFHKRHGHCCMSTRASTAQKKIDKQKKKKKEQQPSEPNNDDEEEEEDPHQIGVLGRWAAGQRNNRKKGKLEDWRIVALDRLGFVWDAREAAWLETYQELKQFHAEHQHIRVLERDHPSLNRWLRFQRDNYRDFQKNGFVETRDDGSFAMNQERCDLLEALGMEWGTHDERWVVLFGKLQEIYRSQGHVRTLPTTGKHSDRLRDFVAKQREAYQEYRKGGNQDCTAITTERVLLLESIQFPWTQAEADSYPGPTAKRNSKHFPSMNGSNQPNDEWMAGYKKIKEFYEEHHHFNYEEEHPNPTEAKQMKAWDKYQREQYKEGSKKGKNKYKLPVHQNSLTPERMELLRALDFFQTEVSWPLRMAQLRRFHAKHGHAMIMYQYPDNQLQELANWAAAQREEHGRFRKDVPSKLTSDRDYQLSSLGFNFALPPAPSALGSTSERGESTTKRPLELVEAANDRHKKRKPNDEKEGSAEEVVGREMRRVDKDKTDGGNFTSEETYPIIGDNSILEGFSEAS